MPLTHEQKMAIDAQVREELGPRPAVPSCFTFQSYAPYSDAALMDKTAGYFAGLDACSAWDRAFRKRFREIEADLRNSPTASATGGNAGGSHVDRSAARAPACLEQEGAGRRMTRGGKSPSHKSATAPSALSLEEAA